MVKRDDNLEAAQPERSTLATALGDLMHGGADKLPLLPFVKTVAEAISPREKPEAKSSKPAPQFTAMPSMLSAFESFTFTDETIEAKYEFQNVIAFAVMRDAKNISATPRAHRAGMKFLAQINPRLWRACLAAAAVHERMEPVTGELAKRAIDPMHLELKSIRDWCKENGLATEDTAQLMALVAVQKYRSDDARAAAAVQRAWTSMFVHPTIRHIPWNEGQRFRRTDGGAEPTYDRPLETAMLERLVAEADADKWIFQGEEITALVAKADTSRAEAARIAAEKAAIDAARNKIVGIVPAKENILSLLVPITNAFGNVVGSGRELSTFAWPFAEAPLSTHEGGPIFCTIENRNVEIRVKAHELDSARRRHPRASLFASFVDHMRTLPGAQTPIDESECMTNKDGIFAMRSRISEFHKLINHMMPALQVETGDQHRWFLAALVQAGTRGFLLHPGAVATNLERMAKQMAAQPRAFASDVMRVTENGYGALRGGTGAWCPRGFLLNKKGAV